MFLVNRLKHANYIVSFPVDRDLYNTLGSAIRRIILSSTPGKSIVSVLISSVNYEYQDFLHTKEDIVDIILNLQKISFITKEESKSITLNVKGPCIFKAKDIEYQYPDISVGYPDLDIMSVTDDKEFTITCLIKQGTGSLYPTNDNLLQNIVFFNPVLDLSYDYKDSRINFYIKMNGDIDPRYAFDNALNILKNCLDTISNNVDSNSYFANLSLSKIELDNRIVNALSKSNILNVGDLLKLTQKQLLSLPSIGQDSFNKVIQALQTIDITLSEE